LLRTDLAPTCAHLSLHEEGYLHKSELASFLQKTVRTIDRMILNGDAPPFVRVGRTVLFRKNAVLEWLRDRERPARPIQKTRGGTR
jgi:excisionase family DNA binding protein